MYYLITFIVGFGAGLGFAVYLGIADAVFTRFG